MQLYDIKTNQVMKHILAECQENVVGFNKYTDDSQKLLILNALMTNVVQAEIIEMVAYMLENK